MQKKHCRGKPGRRQKIKCRERCLWDPSTKHRRGIIHTRRSARGKRIQKWGLQPTHLGNGSQAEQGCTVKMEHLASSPLLPQSASLTQLFNREFRLCIPGCSDLVLQIQQLNPTKVLRLRAPPLPIPTHGTKLLRTREVHSRKQWLALK